MTRQVVSGNGQSLGPYSDGVYAGELLFLSGRVGLVGTELAAGVAAQTSAAISNSEEILEQAGLTLADVVRCTIYLVDMGDFEEVNAVYAQAFASPRPARTTIAVAALPLGARIEIEMVALAQRRAASPS